MTYEARNGVPDLDITRMMMNDGYPSKDDSMVNDWSKRLKYKAFEDASDRK